MSDGVGVGERDHAADFVLELADVAGPAGTSSRCSIVSSASADAAFPEFVGGPRDEVVHERRDLVAAFAQRRNAQPDDIQAVEQIFAEPTVVDRCLEVGVGRGDDADVDGQRRGLAERGDLARFEEAEQLGLQIEAQLADFVEEEGAAAGGADEARVVAVGAGERAAAMAEELAFEQIARDGGAVEGDERLRRRGRSSGESRARGFPCRCRSRR